MISVASILNLHQETVQAWHDGPVENPYEGLLGLICEQHAYNFRLWHEEDIARSRDVADTRIAEVKRNIDRFNQKRNDWIEKVDDYLTRWLLDQKVTTPDDTPINSETPGSIVDRLSILALRIYHLEEQLGRGDVDHTHIESVRRKLGVCREQRQDLARALETLVDDLLLGRKRHKTYRQFKMYNDPTLNPYLYADQLKRAG